MVNDIEINSDRFAQVRNARNTETAEDYTEMIADLIRETGEARAVDLAKHFGVTGPTVNSMLHFQGRQRNLVTQADIELHLHQRCDTLKKSKICFKFNSNRV